MDAALTLPAEQRDYADWRQGRARYAVWAIDLDLAPLRERCARLRAELAGYLLDGDARQPHVTLHLCGFPLPAGRREDDFTPAQHAAQRAALAAAALAPFAIEIGAPASFASAAYFQVGDPQGGIAHLRRVLAAVDARTGGAGRIADYVPHVTVGLYRGRFALAPLRARLAASTGYPPLRLRVADVHLLSYEAAVVGGPLSRLDAVPLVPRVPPA